MFTKIIEFKNYINENFNQSYENAHDNMNMFLLSNSEMMDEYWSIIENIIKNKPNNSVELLTNFFIKNMKDEKIFKSLAGKDATLNEFSKNIIDTILL